MRGNSFVIVLLVVLLSSLATAQDIPLTEAQTLLDSTFNDNLIFSNIGAGNICLIMGDNSFDVIKEPSGFVSTLSSGNCDGPAQEDLIIKFNSYEDFVELANDPSPTALAEGRGGNKYYILSSKLVQFGGNVVCDAEFKAKYCGAAQLLANPDELIGGDLVCCLDSVSKEQESKIAEHYSSGNFVNEASTSPTTQNPSSSNSLFYVLGGSIFFLLILVLVSVIVVRSKPKQKEKEIQDPKIIELENYISQTLSQGYEKEQIIAYLGEQGWSQDKINEAIIKVQNEIQNSKISIPEK